MDDRTSKIFTHLLIHEKKRIRSGLISILVVYLEEGTIKK
jgi:hypothetical protein